MLKHRDSIAKIVAVLPELKTIFNELNAGPTAAAAVLVGV